MREPESHPETVRPDSSEAQQAGADNASDGSQGSPEMCFDCALATLLWKSIVMAERRKAGDRFVEAIGQAIWR